MFPCTLDVMKQFFLTYSAVSQDYDWHVGNQHNADEFIASLSLTVFQNMKLLHKKKGMSQASIYDVIDNTHNVLTSCCFARFLYFCSVAEKAASAL